MLFGPSKKERVLKVIYARAGKWMDVYMNKGYGRINSHPGLGVHDELLATAREIEKIL